MTLPSRVAGIFVFLGFVLLLACDHEANAATDGKAAAELANLLGRGADTPRELNFRQWKKVSLLREPLESRGRVLLDLPEHFRWEVVEPEAFVFESREGRLFMGEPGKLRETPGNARGLGANFPSTLQTIFGADAKDIESAFEVIAEKPRGRFRLTPRESAVAPVVESIELELDPKSGALRRVVLRQRGGDQTEIQFFP